MSVRQTISERATIYKALKKDVTPRAKMKSLVRKVIDSSSWLAPLLKQHRSKEKPEEDWITLQEKMCMLGREEDKVVDVIHSITNKLEVLVAFMDYDRESLQKLVQVGRFVAFNEGRTLLEKGQEPRGAYLVLKGRLRIVDDSPLPLAFQVMNEVKKVGKMAREPMTQIKENVKYKKAEDFIGEAEILAGGKRPANVYPEGTVELLYIEKKDFLHILEPTMVTQLRNIKNDLLLYRLFNFLDDYTLNEVVKFGKYLTMPPKRLLKLTFSEDNVPEQTYFLVKGRCTVCQRLLIVRNDNLKISERFKLYYWQDQLVYPDWVEPVYMRAATLHSGSYFGLGERLCKQPIYTETQCTFLTLPFELLAFLKDRLPAYDEAMDVLEAVFPSTIDLFLSYVKGRYRQEYAKDLIRACKARRSNENTVHNVSAILRCNRMRHLKKWRDLFAAHPDYSLGHNYMDLIKELTDRKARRSLLDDRRSQALPLDDR